MDARTHKIIKDIQGALHDACPYDNGTVAAHVYTEGVLLAIVAEVMSDDSLVYQKVARKIAKIKAKRG